MALLEAKAGKQKGLIPVDMDDVMDVLENLVIQLTTQGPRGYYVRCVDAAVSVLMEIWFGSGLSCCVFSRLACCLGEGGQHWLGHSWSSQAYQYGGPSEPFESPV